MNICKFENRQWKAETHRSFSGIDILTTSNVLICAIEPQRTKEETMQIAKAIVNAPQIHKSYLRMLNKLKEGKPISKSAITFAEKLLNNQLA